MDTVVTHARIVTLDPAGTVAAAVAMHDEKIVAIGTNDDILALKGPKTRHLYAHGLTVLPGFIEPHGECSGSRTFPSM